MNVPPVSRPSLLPTWLVGYRWKAAVILLVGLFIYAPVFSGGWLMDDNLEVSDNVVVHDAAGLSKIWAGEGGADYLPLKTTVEWLLWQVFGNSSTSFHLTSIAFHLGSALLLWNLFSRLRMRHAWLGGLLFIVHPIFVGSVAWVSELKNTLSLAFLLAAMLAYVTFDERYQTRSYTGAIGLFVAALLCKASVVVFPVVILLYIWWKHGHYKRRDLLASAPFFAISALAAATTIWMQNQRAIRTETYPLGGVGPHLALAGMDIVFYLSKILIPFGLLPMYPRWQVDPPTAVDYLPYLLLAVLAAFLWLRRRASWMPSVTLGFGFFLLNLLPVLGFFKMSYMRISWVADHFVYVAAIGIIGLVAAGLGALYDYAAPEQRALLRIAGWLGLGCLTISSRLHAEVYSNLESMTRYTIAHNPDAWLAHQLLAATAQHAGDTDTALTQAALAVQLRPGVAETQNSLGMALDSHGQFQEGIVHLQEAHHLAPSNWAIRENLAKCLAEAGEYALALEQYRPLLEHAPRDAVLHSNAGACLLGLGQQDDAIGQFQTALTLNPGLQSVRENLAVARQRRDRRLSSPAQTPPLP